MFPHPVKLRSTSAVGFVVLRLVVLVEIEPQVRSVFEFYLDVDFGEDAQKTMMTSLGSSEDLALNA